METSKHVFFDLDRTLWDFEKNSQQALKILYNELQLKDKIHNFYDFYHKYKNINSDLWILYGKGKITKEQLRISRFEKTLNKFGIIDEKLTIALNNGYIDISPNQTNVFPKAIETLSSLKKDGFKLHIITNGFKEVQYRKIENCGFTSFFEVIVCSEEVGKNKPSIEVFQHAMKLAQTNGTNSVMIGDDLHVDIIGASNAGMHSILFNPTKKYKKYTSGYQISSLDQIPGILPWVFRD